MQMLSRWHLSKNFTQVFNNKCDLRKPPTVQNYEKKKDLKTASRPNENWASGFNSAAVLKSQPTGSSRYSSATVGTRRSQVRLGSFSCRLEDPRNPLDPPAFEAQTIHSSHAAPKRGKKAGDAERKSKKCARKTNCDCPET